MLVFTKQFYKKRQATRKMTKRAFGRISGKRAQVKTAAGNVE